MSQEDDSQEIELPGVAVEIREEEESPVSGEPVGREDNMTINLKMPDIQELKPRITVFGVGGAGGNAVNNMITAGLQGCDFVCANTDAQALAMNHSDRLVQMGVAVTEGLGAGSQPEVGSAAAEEVIDEINDHLSGSHMVFITAGMGGGTGTGAAPVIARAAREQGILTVGVVTKPFQFEGARRMRIADSGIDELQRNVDTLIVIPNQNLFRIANAQTTFADAFAMADQVLYSGVACITDLMVKEGLINLDFADVRSVMRSMGKAMMGTGEASGEKRAQQAAEAAIANPLLDESSMKGAKGLLISITGGNDLTLFEVDEAATRIREEVDSDANIILGATFDETLDGIIRVSVVATGIDKEEGLDAVPFQSAAAQTLNSHAPALASTPDIATAKVATAAAKTGAANAAAQAVAKLEKELAIPEPAAVAVASDPDVEIKRVKPASASMAAKSQMIDLEEDTPAPALDEKPVSQPYIPPVAEEHSPAPRMPRVEDFPPIAQREMRAQQTPATPSQQQPAAQQPAEPATSAPVHDDVEEYGDEDRRPMGLLRRLASGLGRREDEEDQEVETSAPVARKVPQMQPAPVPVPRAPQARASSAGAAGQLDETGRAAPKPVSVADDDQLEIPAFLRRQAN
ncbi:cell division protein FtsZ [Labrenzia sp. EL_208]|uniref:Cell division protein FtsZ n=2 Tax=Roseibium album TaxID=311410 RepID=A0A0M7APV7_9HYPH|nr:cell division protein FtsZ [Labrenzia sp. EL_195]MBG6173187.1 cell division protein FtsZ [Labrenzia sp. EL_132]MBG6228043.1 cell division protein FtsZ [Labrenzia sp. EL_208]CTQ59737.1 Cell division protein FtsZ [Roseibium album]CTQ76157.1 Cell division protein FtsZ [Roseibium album]